MKTSYAVGLVVVSVMITVAVEESRIATLRREGGHSGAEETVAKVTMTAGSTDLDTSEAASVRTKGRAEMKPAAPAKPAEPEDESLAKTVRKMWDNPAGKSMMNQGVKIAVAMMYQEFIDGLDLTKDEAEYFKTLLGQELSVQQEMGMKMMSATPEEQTALLEEMKQRTSENQEAIKTFLNNDADCQSFTDYKDRLPERQQLDGIRATMESKGAPLDAETESRLLEAMHRTRTESKSPDLSGPEAMSELAKGNMVETFEKNWETQQESLRAETAGILTPVQMEAFQEYQKQMKEMQIMGLKMAEKMIQPKQTGDE